MIDQQVSYLKEVQGKEKKSGVTQKVVAVEYSGLVGQFLSTDEKTFDGYTPVVVAPLPPAPEEQTAAVVNSQDVVAEVAPVVSTPTPPVVQNTVTREEIEQLIRARVAELLAEGNNSTQPSAPTVTEPTPTPSPAEPTPAPEPAPPVDTPAL